MQAITANTNLYQSIAEWQEVVDKRRQFLTNKKTSIESNDKGVMSWWHKVALSIVVTLLLYSGMAMVLAIGLLMGLAIWVRTIHHRLHAHMWLNERYEEQAQNAHHLEVFRKNHCDAVAVLKEDEDVYATGGTCIPVVTPLTYYEATTIATAEAPLLVGLRGKTYRRHIYSYRGKASCRRQKGVIEYCPRCGKELKLRNTWAEANCGHRMCAPCSIDHYKYTIKCKVCKHDVTAPYLG